MNFGLTLYSKLVNKSPNWISGLLHGTQPFFLLAMSKLLTVFCVPDQLERNISGTSKDISIISKHTLLSRRCISMALNSLSPKPVIEIFPSFLPLLINKFLWPEERYPPSCLSHWTHLSNNYWVVILFLPTIRIPSIKIKPAFISVKNSLTIVSFFIFHRWLFSHLSWIGTYSWAIRFS